MLDTSTAGLAHCFSMNDFALTVHFAREPRMILKPIDELAANSTPEVKAVIKLLHIASQDQPYIDLIRQTYGKKQDFENRKQILELGHFNGRDFMNLVMSCNDSKGGTSFNIVTSLLRKLIEWGIVIDSSLLGSDSFVAYQWHKKRIAGFLIFNILDNVLFGPSYISRKYRRSVPAVFVEKDKVQRTGTGFVTTLPGSKKNVVITAKHNVDPSEGITFLSFSEPEGVTYKPLAETWVLHPTLDLALLPVECSEPPIPIFLIGTPTVLSRTITLGYPTIATTDEQYILAHGGEVNAVVKSYHGDELVVISNTVAPGNSGGPVLDEAGLCVGLVVRALETTHEGGVDKTYAAIPSGPILHFVAPHCQP
ncbi:serine protease [Inquilinus limosus]|uniref:S1 family peptidase n=1 Tax=Inquilinus limosus TaxID=171674 RepID=UPI003F13727C